MPLKRTAIADWKTIAKLEEFKAQLKIDTNHDDSLITTNVLGAIDYIYNACDYHSLRLDTYSESFDAWPTDKRLVLSAFPLGTISSVAYTDINGTTQTISSTNWSVDSYRQPSGIIFNSAYVFPTLGDSATPIIVTYTAGYASSTELPALAKVCLFSLVAHWYENREGVVVGTIASVLPYSVQAMLSLLSRQRVF